MANLRRKETADSGPIDPQGVQQGEQAAYQKLNEVASGSGIDISVDCPWESKKPYYQYC
jgi:hypothetical protein